MSFDQAVVKELRRRVAFLIEGLSVGLSKGQVGGWPEYQNVIGQIQGLNTTLTFIDEIETDLRKG